MTLDFDEDDDVLYVTFAEPKTGVRYAETERGDVLRFCADTNEIVGITILFFSERAGRGEKIEIPEVGVIAFSSAMKTLLSAKRNVPATVTTH